MSEKKPNILIVDDDPSILEILAAYVSSFGFANDTAENGLAALGKLKNKTYSIVITDMMMPNMDGMQLLKQINELYPQIKVIVVTGYDRTFTYTDVIRAGASDFIAKPFNPDELEAKLNRIVREQEMLQQLEYLSICDGLTNLYNRRHFDIKLYEETQRAHRQKNKAFLILADVDNFKEYNDKFGHPAGDKLLKALSEILQQCIRKNVDWVFRYGGDEFSIILSQIDLKQAEKTGERILNKIHEQNFPLIGLSIGLALFIQRDGNSWEDDIADLVDRADKALYLAKNTNRGQVIIDQESTIPKQDTE